MKPIVLPKIFQPFFCKDIVRVGRDNDGGYLVNKQDIKKTKKLVSLGIRDDWSFEEDFAKINDCPIVSYDGDIEEKYKKSLKSFFKKDKVFTNKNVGKKDNEVEFSSLIEKDIFLKCDVEGAEYAFLEDIIKNTKMFTGMVIEFHGIENYEKFNELTNFISKINQKLVHVHVNNWTCIFDGQKYYPQVIELTFSSSDNISYEEVNLPHKLDMPNCSTEQDFCILF